METNIRLKLKKTASGVGFFVVSIILAMNIISVILAVPAYLRAPTISNSLMSLLQLIASITGMFIIGLFYCLLSKTSLNEVLPFKKVKPDLMIKTVVMALAVVFVANYLTDYFVQGMSLFGLHNNVSMSFESHNVVDNILYIISVAIIPALTEEFAFRGIILHKLRKYGDAYAVFISALLFGLLHGNIVQIPFAFTVGIAVGFITIKTGSILPAIIVHFLNNLTSVIVSVIGENNLCDPALTDAVMWGHMLNNPCNRVRPPRVKKTEPRFLDEVEAKRLFELLEEERIDIKTAIRVLVLTGCRRGELLGLHWSDVDFEQSLISFKENLLYTPETGKPLNPDSFSKKFINFIKAHQDDLPYVSVHSMRHTNATLMISSHVAITTVAARLGHANTSTTAKIYAHAIKSADEAAAETLEDLLNPNDSTNTA